MAWRALDLDGEVLLFDRRTGTNMLVANDHEQLACHACGGLYELSTFVKKP